MQFGTTMRFCMAALQQQAVVAPLPTSYDRVRMHLLLIEDGVALSASLQRELHAPVFTSPTGMADLGNIARAIRAVRGVGYAFC